jgi:RimJ/RimL family protein N-acetyltransferase
MGFIGLNYTAWEPHFTPAVKVCWRLRSHFCGKGHATGGAKASLHYGFNTVILKKIVSFTVPANVRSIRVMEKNLIKKLHKW